MHQLKTNWIDLNDETRQELTAAQKLDYGDQTWVVRVTSVKGMTVQFVRTPLKKDDFGRIIKGDGVFKTAHIDVPPTEEPAKGETYSVLHSQTEISRARYEGMQDGQRKWTVEPFYNLDTTAGRC